MNWQPRHLCVALLIAGDLALTGLALFLADQGRHRLPIYDWLHAGQWPGRPLLEERVKLELTYIENYSILEDIKILVKTLPAVLSGRGSY